MKGKLTAGLVLCVAAVVGVSGVVAASASAAEPAIYECLKLKANKTTKKYEGKYTDKKCSILATEVQREEGKVNKYELKEGIGKGKPFVSHNKKGATAANLAVEGLGGVACTATTDTGQFTGPKSAGKIVATFTGCELNKNVCASAGQAPGVIKTNPLKGVVGYVEGGKAKHEVGVELSAETGLYEAEFHCGSEQEFRVSGSVIGLVTSAENVFTKEATLHFGTQSGEKGELHQAIEQLEGGPKVHLVAEVRNVGGEYGAARGAFETVNVTNKGDELELKA